ncbi:acetolactate decarboxylase [Lacticaseibacillus porcinae]|uniref:acetolactate decarboxylase n=1 Tax=Lacticaseibacillus porcinae TaxID=1123687 RepID=UPI000F7B3BC4|nr:acetolactate decarboxylase [Lacticaseibacillus porcinae]
MQLFQHGTLANLVPGLFNGTLSIHELLQHGDTGIGTLTGLDGELIILQGTVYQVNAQGVVRIVEADEMVPFANVHFADFTAAGAVDQVTDAQLRDTLAHKLVSLNVFSSVTLTGTFANVTTRAVAAQTRPYPSLKATAAAQSVFTRDTVTGTIIGYYSPKLFAGAAAPGFHLHFLSDDHQFGGHLLHADVLKADLQLQAFENLDLHLPINEPEFLKLDLDSDEIVSDIELAEK